MAGLIAQAQQVRKAGRYGDSQLIHVNPDEKAMLDRMAPMTTINPETGLPEYFSLKKVFKGAKKAVKGVVKGVTNTVKGALEGDIMSIAGLALGVYTGGTALGAWGAGTVAAGGAGSIFSSGTFSGAMSALGSNMSNMATSAWNALSGGAQAAGAALTPAQTVLSNGVITGTVPNAAVLTTGAAGGAAGAASGGGISGMLSGMGNMIAKNPTAFSIAGQAAASMLEAQAAQDTADTNLEIAKNKTRWDNEAIAENYADSGYFGQDLGFKSPDYARQLLRPDGSNVYDRRGLVAHRLNQAGGSNG